MIVLTLLLVFLTFLTALIDKFSNKPIEKRPGILKKLELNTVSIFLLGSLLVIQIISTINDHFDKEVEKEQLDKTVTSLEETNNSLTDVNSTIDKILINVQNQVEATENEIIKIDSLSNKLVDIRSNVEKSIEEYADLNESYKKKLILERKKIQEEAPNVRVESPKFQFSTVDSIEYFSYGFKLVNFGKRKADTVHYSALLILKDSVNKFATHNVFYKHNLHNHNSLSIEGNNQRDYFFYSNKLVSSQVKGYKSQYLVIRVSYFDWFTKSWINPKFEVYGNIGEIVPNRQLGRNISNTEVRDIEDYMKEIDATSFFMEESE